jgi:hypothetical protein
MRLWIAMTLMAVGLAAGTWWLTQPPSPEPEPIPVAAPRPEEGRTSPTSMVRTPPREHHIIQAAAIEPIAVVPEIDELQQSPITVPTPSAPTIRVGLDRLAPRPETGIEPLPWMPYADQTERLARQTAEPPLFRPVRELQETAEPPLDMPASTWRIRGKLPCSVK